MKHASLLLGFLASQFVATCQVFVAWGDSMTAGFGGTPWPEQFTTATGLPISNQGVNGDTSTAIAARFLAQPALFGERTVIWAGRNNFAQKSIVENDIATMVSHLTTSDYWVLGLTNRDHEPIGTGLYEDITTLNLDLATIYGSHFIDIRRILVDAYDPHSAADVADFTLDVVPSSLRSDELHLNTAGYGIVAQAVAAKLVAVPEPAHTAWLAATGCALAALGLRKRKT